MTKEGHTSSRRSSCALIAAELQFHSSYVSGDAGPENLDRLSTVQGNSVNQDAIHAALVPAESTPVPGYLDQ